MSKMQVLLRISYFSTYDFCVFGNSLGAMKKTNLRCIKIKKSLLGFVVSLDCLED